MIYQRKRWMNGEYPYDLAECGYCATQHAYKWNCTNTKHAEMKQEAQELKLYDLVYGNDPGKLHRTVLAFRERFAEFYKRKT
jgi:hypothetical protein